MATSAFKSMTKRNSVGGGSGDSGSGSHSIRRSRSVSRFSRPIEHDAPRGTAVQFPEISLDDLALEFFSSSSSWNENGSDGGAAERKERQGRSVSRWGEVGRWASETASSKRKSRSVSRTRGDASSKPAVVRERNASLSGGGPRRRRSLSVARNHICDSESEVNHIQNSSNRTNVKAPTSGNGQPASAPKAMASSNRRLRRTQSYKDLQMSHDGYSSHSSALTDDESKDTPPGRNGVEKIIRPVYSQKKREPPTEDVGNGGLYEVMRQELRYAVEEIRTELNQAMCRNLTARTSGRSLQTDNSQNFQYSTKLEQCKQEILSQPRALPDSRTSSVVEKPSRARKRSTDKHRMSRRLTEEAEKYLEDFISNIEDTDISSFDGERSDGSSNIPSTTRIKGSAAKSYKSSAASNSCPSEMDGVIFPWLQWETIHDGSPSPNSKIQTPITPKALKWDMDAVPDPINHSASSQDSWSPALLTSRHTKEDMRHNDQTSCYDVEEYLNLKNNEELLFEIYRERNRIHSGRLLVCTSVL